MSQPDFTTEQWQEVSSSMIAGIGTKDGYLVVRFKNGDIYRYPDLSEEFYTLTSAPSVGRYFHENIRSQECQKLARGEWPD